MNILTACISVKNIRINILTHFYVFFVVRNVGVEQTVTIPFLDTLGELDEIAIFMTDIQYVSSPCFLDRINNGDVLVAADLDGQTDLVSQAEGGNQDLQSLLQDMVAFVGPFSTTPFAHPVPVSEYLETTNAAIYEWMLFYAAFFNKEDVGNQAVMAAADRCKLLVSYIVHYMYCYLSLFKVLTHSFSRRMCCRKCRSCPSGLSRKTSRLVGKLQ
jgi:hypothetical protein